MGWGGDGRRGDLRWGVEGVGELGTHQVGVVSSTRHVEHPTAHLLGAKEGRYIMWVERGSCKGGSKRRVDT